MKCKKCGHEEFEYTESYKSKISILWKIPFVFLFIIFFIFSIIGNEEAQQIYPAICSTMVIIAIVIKIYENNNLRKSHTKAICKNCGYIKYID